jgi:hypothetical protein
LRDSGCVLISHLSLSLSIIMLDDYSGVRLAASPASSLK